MITITPHHISLEEIALFLRTADPVRIDPQVRQHIDSSRAVIENILREDVPVYGVNTGFGKFSEVRIKPDTLLELQRRLILSHAAGVGDPMPREIVRLMMFLKIVALARGYSGCRWEVIGMLCDMLNLQVLPVVPQSGSVGASGDLAPLAHMALVMMGEGEAEVPGENDGFRRMNGAAALKQAGLHPLVFQAKEGLAVLNGTQAMSAYALHTLLRARHACRMADITGAMSLEALLGSLTPFDERIHTIRHHPGQVTVAANFRKLLKDSPIVASHKTNDEKVQDAYSLRCIPQVHGAVRDALSFTADVLIRETNGVTDNPVVFSETGEVLSGGNFHGAPVGYVSDLMSIVLTDLAGICERRIEHMLDPSVSQLPGFLTREGGLNSGFMIAHVTAAALTSECKVLSHPASVDSIPTSANKEDHVSMGLHAARKTAEIISNLERILAVELLCACQALDLRHPLKPADATAAVLERIRRDIAVWQEDRLMAYDMKLAVDMVRSDELVTIAEAACGTLD